jgi:hypothetical protein
MPTIINDITNNTERTVKIFDNFYDTQLAVNASEFDLVFSYFKKVSDNDVIAGNFTANLFRISQLSEINVLDLLDQLKGVSDKMQMNKIICYYLNSFKSNISLYGIGVVLKPSQIVARNVVL